MTSFYLNWEQNGLLVRGFDGTEFVDGDLTFPIGFPGKTSDALAITLRSTAALTKTFETLQSVSFYLTGSDVPTVQGEWPYYGNNFTPNRPELNGGFEISFDSGNTWQRFSNEAGSQANPSTWIQLSTEAIGSTGLDGVLGAFDTAHLMVRYVVPPPATNYKVLDIRLAVDFDVI